MAGFITDTMRLRASPPVAGVACVPPAIGWDGMMAFRLLLAARCFFSLSLLPWRSLDAMCCYICRSLHNRCQMSCRSCPLFVLIYPYIHIPIPQ
jgi:hypothetical protein